MPWFEWTKQLFLSDVSFFLPLWVYLRIYTKSAGFVSKPFIPIKRGTNGTEMETAWGRGDRAGRKENSSKVFPIKLIKENKKIVRDCLAVLKANSCNWRCLFDFFFLKNVVAAFGSQGPTRAVKWAKPENLAIFTGAFVGEGGGWMNMKKKPKKKKCVRGHNFCISGITPQVVGKHASERGTSFKEPQKRSRLFLFPGPTFALFRKKHLICLPMQEDRKERNTQFRTPALDPPLPPTPKPLFDSDNQGYEEKGPEKERRKKRGKNWREKEEEKRMSLRIGRGMVIKEAPPPPRGIWQLSPPKHLMPPLCRDLFYFECWI